MAEILGKFPTAGGSNQPVASSRDGGCAGRSSAAQKLQNRGMKVTDRIQKRMLSGTPVRRKSVYL